MLKKLTTVAGMVLLASSFALAGQTAAKPADPNTTPKVAQSQAGQTASPTSTVKKHHKHHKKHHAQASKQ
jgi:hypothetical protein